MNRLMGPVVPCESPGCPNLPMVDLKVGGEHVAWVCPKCEWAIMRKLRKANRYQLEFERGWQDYCAERGYDPLATTFPAAIRPHHGQPIDLTRDYANS